MNIFERLEEYAQKQRAKKERKRNIIALLACVFTSTIIMMLLWVVSGANEKMREVYLILVNIITFPFLYGFWCFIRDVAIPNRKKIKEFFWKLFEITVGLVTIIFLLFFLGNFFKSCPASHVDTDHIHYERY